ncbi:hypothetical protein [Quadrisphaera sp. INWT6]|uniref:hypothetical protein n=1 Tax=Quadrisphaera sp. INWT6 TaxID=2596917 RepID=UPI00189241B8|nr:hypothetical protein [Quadrisphaera sp. INWT6]
MTWYERERDMGVVTDRWLRAARSELPEAVPQRFGGSEPLRHRFDAEGEAGLRRAWDAADGLLFLAARPVVPHAALAAGPRSGRARLGDMGAHVLRVALPPDDPRLRAFVVALTTPATVFVSVNEPLPQQSGSGRGGHRYLAGLGRWLGLPEEPPRWCWFGEAYTGALADPGRRPRPWRWRGPRGGGGDELPQLEPVSGGGLWTGGTWVPQAMRVVEAGLEPHDQQADVIPSAVAPGRPVWAGTRRLRDR